jgi:hypothetical protein
MLSFKTSTRVLRKGACMFCQCPVGVGGTFDGSTTGAFLSLFPTRAALACGRGRMNVEMTGFPKSFLYYNDLFHTLVNTKNWRFTALLFGVYFLLFVVFAIPFYIDVSQQLVCVCFALRMGA